jgi:hypothetical protein
MSIFYHIMHPLTGIGLRLTMFNVMFYHFVKGLEQLELQVRRA